MSFSSLGKNLFTFTAAAAISIGAAFFMKKRQENQPNLHEEQIIQQSLYDKLGGKEKIDAAINKLYDKIMRNKRLNHFFRNTDMKLQIKQQQQYMCCLFGGPRLYQGKTLKEAHKGMNISNEIYDLLVELLVESFIEQGASNESLTELTQMLECIKSDIILQ